MSKLHFSPQQHKWIWKLSYQSQWQIPASKANGFRQCLFAALWLQWTLNWEKLSLMNCNRAYRARDHIRSSLPFIFRPESDFSALSVLQQTHFNFPCFHASSYCLINVVKAVFCSRAQKDMGTMCQETEQKNSWECAVFTHTSEKVVQVRRACCADWMAIFWWLGGGGINFKKCSEDTNLKKVDCTLLLGSKWLILRTFSHIFFIEPSIFVPSVSDRC